MLVTALSSQSNLVHEYARNVGSAARDLIAALLAAKPGKATAEAADSEARVAQGKSANEEFSLFRLYCLASRANSYDAVSPRLAKELRLIAARG
jgi:hypothetical protein